jgi:hypothetical protein
MRYRTAKGDLSARRGLVGLVLIGAALTVGLHQVGSIDGIRIDWSDPIRWFDTARAEEAVAALLRYVGLAIGYWVVASTTLYAFLVQRRRPARYGFIEWITLPGVRRLVDRTLATAFVASIAATPLQPALAEEPPPPSVVFDINTDGVPVPLIRLTVAGSDAAIETSRERPVQLQPPTPAIHTPEITLPTLHPGLSSSSPLASARVGPATGSYTVRSGDNLWIIAASQVETVTGDRRDAATATYWRRLITANAATLRSGDPNLIYPGEILSLPPVEVTP